MEASFQRERIETEERAAGPNLPSAYIPGVERKRKLSEKKCRKSRGIQRRNQPRKRTLKGKKHSETTGSTAVKQGCKKKVT